MWLSVWAGLAHNMVAAFQEECSREGSRQKPHNLLWPNLKSQGIIYAAPCYSRQSLRPAPVQGRGLVFSSCYRRAHGFSYICCDHLWKVSVTAGLSEWQKASLNCFPERGAHHRWARWCSSFWGQMSGLGLERQKRGPAEDWGNLLAVRSYWKQWG